MDAVRNGLGRKSTENNRVNRANARTSQNRNRQLGNHAHVQAHAVAFLYTIVLEHIGKLHDLKVQLFVRQYPVVIFRVVGLKNQSRLIAQCGKMPVQTVLGDVQLSPRKPFNVGFFEIPVEHPIPFLAPHKMLGNVAPELLRFFNALRVVQLVLLDGADLVGGEHGPLRMNNSIGWSGNKLNQNERRSGKMERHLSRHAFKQGLPKRNTAHKASFNRCLKRCLIRGGPKSYKGPTLAFLG